MPAPLLILLGFGLLVVGGELLVRGAVLLARLQGLSPAVVGLTVVATGTSVPELVVAVLAARAGAPDLAVGNVIGSNIFNLTGAIGLAALAFPLSVRGEAIRLEWPVLFASTVVVLLLLRDGMLTRPEAALLLVGLIAFIGWTVWVARRRLSGDERGDLADLIRGLAPRFREYPVGVAAVLLIAGVGLLFVGGRWVVSGGTSLATQLGWSERVIGLTIVAVGTGLPELVTSLVASVRRESDIAVANLIGSSIFNLLGILGASGLILPIMFDPSLASSDMLWLGAITLGLWPILHTGRVVTRREGATLLVVYLVYLFTLLR